MYDILCKLKKRDILCGTTSEYLDFQEEVCLMVYIELLTQPGNGVEFGMEIPSKKILQIDTV